MLGCATLNYCVELTVWVAFSTYTLSRPILSVKLPIIIIDRRNGIQFGWQYAVKQVFDKLNDNGEQESEVLELGLGW